ncbi:PEP-CTERM protein-sorting domain-containing protein [Tissierella praeacuta DSM 18095]|uniref:PEP-CTERM protein-sorting domain-containing protein n=1 Tax=Tissierella praeacuta DSM 18095 TaxID=1123404 RepID=A0A1M4WJE0_9FIRM|nr:CARDB domain-containing protein [Tissierella praeacuta]TCU79091.1 putative secreted protein with PEP-CTERM sorting signal [Tissierella praeacuta]SHE81270.1 PEP-CTERM protein-sorting domain-containing protein [Tissierella praeacuta DSM 18095]SUO99376.1 putative carboxyl-terminal-processing protease, deltaproteobacterial [Tissierella praeacuta]
MKKFLSVFLVVLLVILQMPTKGLADKDNNDKPNLTITSSNVYLAEAGERVSISIKLKNTSDYYAENISATLSSKSSDVYVDGSAYDDIPKIKEGKTNSLSFKVRVDEKADEGNHELSLNIVYYNEYGEKMEPISHTINVRVTNKAIAPLLIVDKVNVIPNTEVNAGETIAVGFDIENIGSGLAKDIKVTLDGLSNENFVLANGVNYKVIPSLDSDKKYYLYFELKSLKTLKPGNYKIDLSLSYKDIKNQVIKDESNFFITIASNNNRSSNLIIENLVYPTGTLFQNKELDIKFNIRNQGQVAAEEIIIEAKSTDQTGLVPKSVSIVKLDSLEPDAIQELNFKFFTTKAAETKNYPIEITVKYIDELGKEDTVNQLIGIFVEAPDKDAAAKGKPKLIIDKYSFEPQLVKAGENFDMTLSFYNTSSKKTVKNIKIFLTAEPGGSKTENNSGGGSSAFTPVDSSNTFYIDSIKPKGKVEKKITMFTIPDAIAKTHTITANFEYEDSEGTELKDVELIGVPVVQQSRLETAELQVYPEAFVGQQSPVSIEFYNTGKVTLYNMMVKLEGDFQTENGSYYIGNFDTGNSESFEGMVIPSQPGELKGAVLFTYEDSTGQKQELRKEFSLNVAEMPPMEENPDDMPPMEENRGFKKILKSKWLWITLILLGAGTGGFFFYKKKKKEKEMSLDE